MAQTLVDMEYQTSSSTAMTALIMTMRAFTTMIGNLFFGFLFDRFHHGLLLGVSCVVAAGTMQGLAFVDSILVSWTLAALNGLATGSIPVGKYDIARYIYHKHNCFRYFVLKIDNA